MTFALQTKQRRAVDPIDAFARRLEPRMRAVFLRAVAAMRAVDRKALERALASESVVRVEQALRVTSFANELRPLRGVVLDAVRGGGELGAARLGASLAFDIADPAVIRIVQESSARLIREIDATTREGIRRIIENEFRRGASPVQAARAIQRRIGLTSAQQQIVSNYEATLRAAVGGDATWNAVRSYALNPIRGPGGLIESRIDSAVDQYSERLLRMRANTIARTETIRAANAGRREHWRQMDERGVLPSSARRQWVTSLEGPCAICAPLAGSEARIDGSYDHGNVPGEVHPNCRCVEVLVDIEGPPVPVTAFDVEVEGQELRFGGGPSTEQLQRAVRDASEWITEFYEDFFTAEGRKQLASVGRAFISEQARSNAILRYGEAAVLFHDGLKNLHEMRRYYVMDNLTDKIEERFLAEGITGNIGSRVDARAERYLDNYDNAIDDWSGDATTRGAAALRMSAKRRLGVPIAYHGHGTQQEILKRVAEEARKYLGHDTRIDEWDFLNAHNQAFAQAAIRRVLKEAGSNKTTITVYRGTTVNAWRKSGGSATAMPRTGSKGRLRLNAGESWSLNPETAYEFAEQAQEDGRDALVLKAEVPINRVLESFVTNKKLITEELEVILAGDPVDNVKVDEVLLSAHFEIDEIMDDLSDFLDEMLEDHDDDVDVHDIRDAAMDFVDEWMSNFADEEEVDVSGTEMDRVFEAARDHLERYLLERRLERGT